MDDDLREAILQQIAEHQMRIDALKLLLPENSNVSRNPRGKRRRRRGPEPKRGSIMEDVMSILEAEPDGLKASTILERLNRGPRPGLARESLSPQLSRLKHRGYLDYRDGRWLVKGEQLPLPYVVEEAE